MVFEEVLDLQKLKSIRFERDAGPAGELVDNGGHLEVGEGSWHCWSIEVVFSGLCFGLLIEDNQGFSINQRLKLNDD